MVGRKRQGFASIEFLNLALLFVGARKGFSFLAVYHGDPTSGTAQLL